MSKIVGFILFLAAMPSFAAEIQFGFNSPSFSGAGYSSHILTIQQLENQATSQNQAAAAAIKQQAEAAAANTPQAQFIANLQSRIYSQLAQQLTNSIFGGTGNPTCTTPGTVCGTIPDLGGNTVTWGLGSGSNNGMILINITNNSNPSQTTQISVPAGTFYF